MGLSNDNIVAKFPIKNFVPSKGEPDYASTSDLIQGLYSDVVSLAATTIGGGQHGRVGLLMPILLYATLSDTPNVAFPDPGSTPKHHATAATHHANKVLHTKVKSIFKNHYIMDSGNLSEYLNP